jgi:hypothetical protein
MDFKQAKEKWNLTANTPIRIVFLGEPAVDDGGPKREFFSGNFSTADLIVTDCTCQQGDLVYLCSLISIS